MAKCTKSRIATFRWSVDKQEAANLPVESCSSAPKEEDDEALVAFIYCICFVDRLLQGILCGRNMEANIGRCCCDTTPHVAGQKYEIVAGESWQRQPN